jgi:hypothetical protein
MLHSISRSYNHTNLNKKFKNKNYLKTNLDKFNTETMKVIDIPNLYPKVAVLKCHSGIACINRYVKNDDRFKCIADIGKI